MGCAQCKLWLEQKVAGSITKRTLAKNARPVFKDGEEEPRAAASIFDRWDALLATYLKPAGEPVDGVRFAAMDYKGLAGDPDFKNMLEVIARLDAADVRRWPTNARLALYINSYNALCAEHVCRHIRSGDGVPASVRDCGDGRKEVWDRVAGTVAGDAPIIPISAVLKYNVDAVCEYIAHAIPTPVRDFTSTPRLIVIRSFDVNKPGEDVENLKGGVAGGSILQGVLRMGDEVEVRPGLVKKDGEGTVTCSPIYSRVVSLLAEQNALEYAVPGGLIGVGTHIDPTLTRADRLVGQVLGVKGKLPDVFIEVEISFYLLRRLLGVKTQEGSKQAKVQKLQKQEILMVNIGSTATGGKVLAVKADLAKILLTQPVCTTEGEKIALSRRVDKHWRLIGWGQIRRGSRVDVNTA
mmetsp:Transcript_1824/g.5495  ORF Transcript_1824/g.5495 Transcript_1824/m.5495 type:complete len:409 (+) Transcript_1824:236-1462(+)